MRRLERIPVALLALVALAAALPGAAAAAPTGTAADGRYLVVYERGVANPDAETRRQQSSRGFKARFRYRHTLKGFAAKLTAAQAAGLRGDPDVAAVVPDLPVRALEEPLISPGSAPAGVRRVGAATATTTRGPSEAAVAVIDTGIDLDHPDLNAADGVNCVTEGEPAEDDDGHGTHVAGTIGALNDGVDVVGVAPGTPLVSVKVLDEEGNGRWSQVICGVEWVAQNAAARDIGVANLSLGGASSAPLRTCGSLGDEPLHAALCELADAGVTPVVAAGNEGKDFRGDVPARYPEVLAVSAIADFDGAGGGLDTRRCSGAADDTPPAFSNFATRALEGSHTVAAPGACIRSTLLGGGYGSKSGTSMASPHVAGLVALCLNEAGTDGPCADDSNAEIIERIRGAGAGAGGSFGFAGDPFRPVPGKYWGYLASAAFGGTPGTTIDSPPEVPAPPPVVNDVKPPDPPPAQQPAAPTPNPPATPVTRIPLVEAVAPTVSVARRGIASALKRGLRVSVACAQACSVRSEALLRLGGKTTRVAKGAARGRSTKPVVTVAFPRRVRAKLASARSLTLTIRTRVAEPGKPARYLKRAVTLRR